MSHKNNFKNNINGFGKSFIEMGRAMIVSYKDLPEETQVILEAKLGIAEDLVAEVCSRIQNFKEIKCKKTLFHNK